MNTFERWDDSARFFDISSKPIPLKREVPIKFDRVRENRSQKTFSFFAGDLRFDIPSQVFSEKQRSLFRSWCDYEAK